MNRLRYGQWMSVEQLCECEIPWGPGHPEFDRQTVFVNLVRLEGVERAKAHAMVDASTPEELTAAVEQLLGEPPRE